MKKIYLLTYSTIIIIFVANVLIVQALTPENYGVFAFLLALISLIETPLITRGGEIYLKYIGEHWNSKNYSSAIENTKYLIHKEAIIYFMIFLLFIFLAIIIYFIKGIEPQYLLILALSIPFQIGYSVYKSHLTLVNKVVFQSFIEITFAIVYMILVVGMAMLFGLIGLVFAISLSVLLKTILSRYVYLRMLKSENLDYSMYQPKNTIEHYKTRSFNSVFRNFTQNGIMQIDLVLLGFFTQPNTVALYKIAKTLAGLPLKAAIPVWKILYPNLVKAINIKNTNLKNKTIHKGILITFIMFVSIELFGYIVGEELIVFLYGENYQEAYLPFLILLVGYGLFFAVNGWFKLWVALIDKMQIGSYFYLLVFVLIALAVYVLHNSIINTSIAITTILTFMTLASYIIGRRYE